MRYLILLLFVIPLVSQSATVRGQTCTVTDLENADQGVVQVQCICVRI